MLTWSEVRHPSTGAPYCRGTCLSTDVKPTEGVGNGSVLMEMDTSLRYLYDAEAQAWRPWVEGGNVTLTGDFNVTDDGEGNVTITGADDEIVPE